MCLIFFISNDNIVTEKIPKETLQMAKTNTKIIGKEHYINASTGELMEMDVIESIEKDVDSNFYKLFMKDFLYAMDIVSNQKSKVAYWIIDHLQKDNMFVYSYRQVAEMTGISYQTVAGTIKALKDADFLRQEGKLLIVNPAIIFKGTAARRANVLHRYAQAESGDKQLDRQQRISNLSQTIENLQKQLKQLQMEEFKERSPESATAIPKVAEEPQEYKQA